MVETAARLIRFLWIDNIRRHMLIRVSETNNFIERFFTNLKYE